MSERDYAIAGSSPDQFVAHTTLADRLRNPDESNALIIRRRAADLIDSFIATANDLPLWRLENAEIPDEEYEAVQRFRQLLGGEMP